MVPTVHRHHTHSRKHDGQAQVNYLNAFINLFGLDHHVFWSMYDAYELLVPLVVPKFDCLYAVKY